MKYLWIVLILLSACTHKGVHSNETKSQKPQMVSSSSSNITLLDAYQKTTTGGMERTDGKHTSTAYSIILLKAASIEIQEVYLYGEKRAFDSFEYEGKFYVIVQVYPEATDYVQDKMIQTANTADIFYVENGVIKILGVPKFLVREAVIGN